MSSRPTRVVFPGIVFFTLTLIVQQQAFAQGAAQSAPPRRVSVVITQVKPDMVDAFQALVRSESIPAEKKAGVAWRATFRPVFGELNTFVTVRPVTSYAQFDGPGTFQRALGEQGANRLLSRVRAMTLSQRGSGAGAENQSGAQQHHREAGKHGDASGAGSFVQHSAATYEQVSLSPRPPAAGR